jgi:hypothetical protein
MRYCDRFERWAARLAARGPHPRGGLTPLDRPGAPEFGCGFDTIASMNTPGPQNPYEVYCYWCNVTAPAGTRRCLHCGESLSRGSRDPRRAALAALIGVEPSEEDEEGEETPPSATSLIPKIALWILLLFGGVLYRFCN